ncbi:MAG: LysR family transcriptional regulator [Actinomycetota bacterium]
MGPLLLDLRHYETVAAIVDVGTMSEAARILSASQSALSHRLAEAERRLGTPLFERGPGRRLTPTRAGLAMHQAASRSLGDLARFEAQTMASAEHTVTTLRIAVGSYDCYHWFPRFLRTVHERTPGLDLELTVVGDAPGHALAAGDADIVLAPGEPEGDIELHRLFDDELVVLTGAYHPLAAADSVEVADLLNETYFTYSVQASPGFEYDRFVRPAGVTPRLVRLVRQTSAIIELVAAGAGISILSRWALEPAIEAGRIAYARCGADGLPLTWHAAVRRNDERADVIVELLRDHLAED